MRTDCELTVFPYWVYSEGDGLPSCWGSDHPPTRPPPLPPTEQTTTPWPDHPPWSDHPPPGHTDTLPTPWPDQTTPPPWTLWKQYLPPYFGKNDSKPQGRTTTRNAFEKLEWSYFREIFLVYWFLLTDYCAKAFQWENLVCHWITRLES